MHTQAAAQADDPGCTAQRSATPCYMHAAFMPGGQLPPLPALALSVAQAWGMTKGLSRHSSAAAAGRQQQRVLR